MFDQALSILCGISQSIWKVFLLTWWFVLPLVLLFMLWEAWLTYVRIKFIRGIKWDLLEVRIPREILKTPKAMEEIFNNLHASYSYGFHWTLRYLQGVQELWFSLELVGTNEGVSFYIRTPANHRNLVESAIYAQYPDAEIREVDDYLDALPDLLPNKDFDLFGAELYLSKDNAYPLKTYPIFEAIVEEQRLDPVGTIMEIMSRLKPNEFIFIQIPIRPTGDEWIKQGQALRDKLINRKAPSKSSGGLLYGLSEFIGNIFTALNEPPTWQEKAEEKKEGPSSMMGLTTGEKDIVNAIEEKMAKIAFMAGIRMIYVDSRNSFTKSNVSSLFGAFKHYNTANLNSFAPNKDTFTIISQPALMKQQKIYFRKRMIWDNYKLRRLPSKMSVFNTEELATIYHPPITAVEAPRLTRLEAKKGEPPASLPVE